MKSFSTAALRQKAGGTMSRIFAAGMWMVADGQISDTTSVSYWTGLLKQAAQSSVKVLTLKAAIKIALVSATLEARTKREKPKTR